MDLARKRFRDISREMNACPLHALMPTIYRGPAIGDGERIKAALAYALGLQGDLAEAKHMACSIEAIVLVDAGTIWVGLVDHQGLTEEMTANLTQAMDDMFGIDAARINYVGYGSPAWKSNIR